MERKISGALLRGLTGYALVGGNKRTLHENRGGTSRLSICEWPATHSRIAGSTFCYRITNRSHCQCFRLGRLLAWRMLSSLSLSLSSRLDGDSPTWRKTRWDAMMVDERRVVRMRKGKFSTHATSRDDHVPNISSNINQD
jgi:hypothetical protein